MWRVAQCIEAFESVGFSGVAFRRKFALHICLLLATMVDIPLMISFIVLEQYENFTYSFHKLEAAFIFAAFSITIGDWGSVLFDIREETQVPFAFRKATLLTANVINFGISITNFFFCITSTGDMSSITNSVVYQLGEFVQVILTFVIMVMLLHTGLKLAWRIRGVTGGNSNNSGNMYNKIPKTSSASARGSEGIHSSRASSSRNSMSTVQYPSSNRSSALTGISESAHGPSGSVKDSSDSESSSVNPLLEASITPTSPIQSQTPRKHPVGVPKSYAPALYNQNQSNSYMSNSNGTSNSKRYVNRQRTATGNSAVSYHSSAYSNGFNHALSRLNGVMAICTICFVLQVCTDLFW